MLLQWGMNGVTIILGALRGMGCRAPYWGALAGAPTQGHTDRDYRVGLLEVRCPRALRMCVLNFLLHFQL